METLLAKNVKFILKENVLAIVSEIGLTTLSSAVFNGGLRQVKAVLNIGVPQGYSDVSLHSDPLKLITSSASKLDLSEDYLAMVTAANVNNFSLVTKKTDDFLVAVAATAGCSHGESSGEEMAVSEIVGTINIIVLIEGNPTDSCMVAALITATEAKSAVLRDFDIRSRYTGDSATGTITDSVTVASTHSGKVFSLAGPASKLGKIVGYCTRRAVMEALLKQEPVWCCRTVIDRLKERQLSLDKLALELSKVDDLAIDAQKLEEILKKNPFASASLLAAAKLDDDHKKNLLLPAEFGDINEASKCFAFWTQPKIDYSKKPNYSNVDLPLFLKQALINIIKQSQSDNKLKRLK